MSRPVHGGNLAWAARLAGCPASLILDFSASINPLGPPLSALTAIQAGLKALCAYPDPSYTAIRTALSQWHQLPPDWILPGNGSAELLTWASRDLSALDVTYLITPAFSDYWRACKTFSVKVQPCPMNLGMRDWKDSQIFLSPQLLTSFPSRVSVSSSRAGLLLNNPHNPTGKLFTRESILPYLEQFALVVVDEAFMDFLPPQQQQSLIPLVQDYPNLIIVRSLTKFYSLPGLRLGYVIAHPERLKTWQQWRDPWSVNILATLAAEAVIQDQAFQQQTWDWLVPTRQDLFDALSIIPGFSPLAGSANFLLVQTETSSSHLQEKLLKDHQILIRDCFSFPELGDRYFRVAVRSQADNQRLCQTLAIY